MHLKLIKGLYTFGTRALNRAHSPARRPHHLLLKGEFTMSEILQTTDVAAIDADLLGQTAIAVRAAGSALRERFGEVVRHQTRDELMRALAANDEMALDILRPRLTRLRPDAGWVEDE